MNEIINNILTQVSNGAYNTIGALMITKLLQTLSGSNNFFKDIFIRLEKEIKQENVIKKEEIEFNKILPIMDGLMLNQDSKSMSEMFYNLLKSSIDKETKDFVHPAFPQILKQMSPQEAKLLCEIYKKNIIAIYSHQFESLSLDISSLINKYSIISHIKENETNYKFIFDRLNNMGLVYINNNNIHILGFKNDKNIKLNVSLTDLGKQFIMVSYSNECESLFDTIDLKNYFEKLYKK